MAWIKESYKNNYLWVDGINQADPRKLPKRWARVTKDRNNWVVTLSKKIKFNGIAGNRLYLKTKNEAFRLVMKFIKENPATKMPKQKTVNINDWKEVKKQFGENEKQ